MNREKTFPTALNVPQGCSMQKALGEHCIPTWSGYNSWAPGRWVHISWVSSIVWRGSLDQGTVDITLFGSVPGDEHCGSEAITFHEVSEGGAHGVMVGELGRKYFQLQGWGVWALLLAVWGGWWEKPDSCIWQFRAPGSLGSEAWVWPFFLKGGIAPASC